MPLNSHKQTSFLKSVLESQSCKVFVRVQPNSSQEGFCGIFTDTTTGIEYLKINIHATPNKGEANKSVINFLSKELGIPKSNFSIISGQTQRKKVILIESLNKDLEQSIWNKLSL